MPDEQNRHPKNSDGGFVIRDTKDLRDFKDLVPKSFFMAMAYLTVKR